MLNNTIREKLFISFFENEKSWFYFDAEKLEYIVETYYGNSNAQKLFNALMNGQDIMLYDFETEDKIGKVSFKNIDAMEVLFGASCPAALQGIVLNAWTINDASMWFQFVSFGDLII